MSDPSGKLANGGEPRGVHQLLLQPFHLGVILDQNDAAAAAIVAAEHRFMQRQKVVFAVQRDRLFVQRRLAGIQHAAQ